HDHGDHDHDHAHAGMFHSHEHAGDREGMELLIKALQGKGGRGANVTLLGALSNVGLTIGKGAAGWALNSASLVADAGHSLGDLLGDFVVLATWTWSRKAPTADYPYGYGKYESLGTVLISILLVGGAYFLGQHSLILTMAALEPYMQAATAPAVADVLEPLAQSAKAVIEADPEALALDPNAAWFALISLGVKEWMYRLTKKVADEEKSTVLAANAYHHRFDAWTSGVALFAILGTWAGVPVADPLGGLLVSGAIGWQGCKWLIRGASDLMDAGVPAPDRDALARLLTPLPAALGTPTAELLRIRNVRAVKSGSQLFVDLTADVPPGMTMREAHEVERCIRETLTHARKEVKEVRVHLH
ncbi:cation efflux protein, partial [Calocera cornea HHB12733]